MIFALAISVMAALGGCSSSPPGEGGGGGGEGAGGGGGGDGGVAICGGPGEACCAGVSLCESGLGCEGGQCVQQRAGETGKPCTRNSDCSSGICLPLTTGRNVCTTACAAAGDCVAGWSCSALIGQPSNVCKCSPAAETCNSTDDDCDGIVDTRPASDQACVSAKGAGYVCTNGTCECAATCGTTCVDLRSNASNCGTCGNVCALGEVCAALTCGPDREWSQWPPPADSPPSAQYTTTADTVTDSATGLVWQRNLPASMTRSSAKNYCAGLSLAGMTGWRLPTLIELESIINFGKFNPAIDTVAFPATPSFSFWSSSPNASNTSGAWVVNFDDGSTDNNYVADSSMVRCVR